MSVMDTNVRTQTSSSLFSGLYRYKPTENLEPTRCCAPKTSVIQLPVVFVYECMLIVVNVSYQPAQTHIACTAVQHYQIPGIYSL